MIRETLERHRCDELRRGNHRSASLLDPALYDPAYSVLKRTMTQQPGEFEQRRHM